MRYEQPFFISMTGFIGKGACSNGSGNVENAPGGSWTGELTFSNVCQNGGGNTGTTGALGACLNGSAHSNAGLTSTGGTDINPQAGFCETGTSVISGSGSSYCSSGSSGTGGIISNHGCIPGGNPPPRNCYSGTTPG